MSNTSSHRPLSYWFGVPSAVVETHDHRDGRCDLPTLEQWRRTVAADGVAAAWSRHRCRYDLDWRRLPNLCGCGRCTGRDERRADRRRDRHQSRRMLRSGRHDEL
jgi:hypothetical protein